LYPDTQGRWVFSYIFVQNFFFIEISPLRLSSLLVTLYNQNEERTWWWGIIEGCTGDAERKNIQIISSAHMRCSLPNCEGAKCTSYSYAIDDDMINGKNIFAFNWEHDSAFGKGGCCDSGERCHRGESYRQLESSLTRMYGPLYLQISRYKK
jgi:hypothetical protein